MLLEYSLGTEASYLWVVGVRSMATPFPGPVETLAAHLMEAANQRQDSEYERTALALSNILFGPAANLLGKKRLLVLADGELLSVPFAALPAPGGKVPIVVDHEVVSLPNISVLAHWRKDPATHQPATKTVLVVADPVFDQDDPRLPVPPKSSGGSAQQLPLARLLFSRDEANAVASSLPASQVKLALGFDARKSLLLEPQAAQFRVIHIATHGLLDIRDPELSGLMFSRVDANGRGQDGFLRLYEIFNLDLHADLVVLSACRSGWARPSAAKEFSV